MRRKAMRSTNSAAWALALAAFMGTTTVPLAASVPSDPEPVPTLDVEDPGQVLIVNNHVYGVTVYAVTQAGKRFRLGHLNRSSAKVLSVPDEAVEGSTVLVKVYPETSVAGLGSPADGNPGIRTRLPVSVNTPEVALWLEPDLASSFMQEVSSTF